MKNSGQDAGRPNGQVRQSTIFGKIRPYGDNSQKWY